MARWCRLSIVVAALLGVGVSRAQSAPASQPVRCERDGWGTPIPFAVVDHLPVVRATLAGQERDLLVDTGAFGLAVQAADAAALGLPASGLVASLRLGAIVLRDQPFTAVPKYPAAGGLGHSIYGDAILRLDYRAKTMTLFKAEQRSCLTPLLADAAVTEFRIPARGHETTFPVAFGTAVGAPTALAFFDSGAWSKISAELFEQLRAAGLARSTGPSEAIVSRLVIGSALRPLVLDEVAVHVARPGSQEWRRKGNTTLQLGSRGLGDRCRAITVDYPASRLYLDCPTGDRQPPPADDRTGR